MQEFQPLIDEHKDVYDVIREFKSIQNSTNTYKNLAEVKNFRNLLSKVVDIHFVSEESILFPKISGKLKNGQDLISCVLNEHKEIQHKKELLDELIYKYETNPTNIAYEALVQLAVDVADMLYNHVYAEDITLFSFAGIDLSQEEKTILAEELAKLSCKLNYSKSK